jgi:amino acid adenylation domain-containing protein
MSEPVTAGFQLSPQQKHLWSVSAGQPAVAQVAVLLEGNLDVERLKSSLLGIMNRHEILRTVFPRNAGMKFPFQVVSDRSALPWTEIDLRGLDSTQQDQRVEQAWTLSGHLDQDQAPAVRASLVPLADDRSLLMLSLPGLCADNATLKNLVDELRGVYGGAAQSDADPLQYADYSEWQNELVQKNDEETASAKQYWKQHDASAIPPLVLPFETRQDGAANFQPDSVTVPLDSEFFKRVEQASEGNPASFLLAGWQVLLWRLTGQAEINVGVVSDGRSHEELGNALGLFAKALPLYANFEASRSFADVVRQAKQSWSEAVEFQDYVELTGQGLANGFSVEEKLSKQQAGGVAFSIWRQCSYSNRFHIQLRCTVENGGWSTELVYDRASFLRDIAERVAQRLGILLTAAVADPDVLVSTLPILDASEREKILVGFNQTTAEFPREQCIHHLFEDQAARSPNRPALRCGENQFTYAELNTAANQIAHLLRQRGVKANIPVGLCVERSAEMIVGLLGILKAGGCYVPLVPDNPKARLAHQLAETAAPVVITQQALLDRLPEFGGEIVCLDRDRALLEKHPGDNPQRNNSPEDLVYVIYTSGSTGIPKGVAVRHFNLVNYSHFICRRLQLDEHPQGLNFATVSTISADLGNTCVFPALISGGCLHVIGFEMAMAANLFAEYVAKHPVDVLKITPSHLTTLLNAAEGSRGSAPRDGAEPRHHTNTVLPRQYLVLGGEASSWHLVERIQRSGTCAVLNHYGPTEATVGCCTFAVRENDVAKWAPATMPIGRPIANDEIYILDQHLEPTPIGVPGELCIGGTGLAKGYLNQPQQTAERFVSHPFSKLTSARLYRTGDLARFLPDGNVEFLGRIDHQVKIRGFRVEPAEIEAMLKQHPAVKQSVIVPYEDKAGEKRLAAYIVAAKAPTSEELRAFLLQQLPEYMVPSAFLAIDSIPLTPNGKVDLRALPSPEEGQAKVEREFIAPRNPAEEKLVGIWTEVLKLPQVSVNDNFFELGGHSLLATQIISRIRNTFRVQLPLHSFLETPTVSDLAEKISHCPTAETEEEEMARLLGELDGLSDEEAERLLAADSDPKEKPGSGNR